MQHGTSAAQHLTDKLTTEASAKAELGGALSVGGTAQEERFVERTVTPTAASSFLDLLKDLGAQGPGYHILLPRQANRLVYLEKHKQLNEGDFVQIKKAILVPPRYISPYVGVRQAATLAALFPVKGGDQGALQTASAERHRAVGFAHQVGPDPRMAFVLRPPHRNGGRAGDVRFLLPMQYQELTDERSLLEGTGGSFTVVGKVVRISGPGPNSERPLQLHGLGHAGGLATAAGASAREPGAESKRRLPAEDG